MFLKGINIIFLLGIESVRSIQQDTLEHDVFGVGEIILLNTEKLELKFNDHRIWKKFCTN